MTKRVEQIELAPAVEQALAVEQAITALEAQRAVLGDDLVATALIPLQEKLAALRIQRAGERKQVTILFATIHGLGALSTTDVEEINSVLNVLWQRLDRLIELQEGLVDKHAGTRLMALFGVPSAHEDDPHRAVRAALAMRAAVASLSLSDLEGAGLLFSKRSDSLQLTLSVGINTGQVMLGELGSTAEYTAVGDAVNVASRLEEAALPDRILVSQDTYRHVRGFFEAGVREPVQAKGKTEPVPAYEISSEKPRAFPVVPRPVAGRETPTIGRAAHLGHLQAALQETIDQSRAGVVMLVGEAGIGKTRVLHEFQQWLLLMPGRVWLFRAYARSLSSNLPYAVIHDLLAFRFEILDSDPASVARYKLEKGVVHFLGEPGIEKAHYIGHLIGFDFSDSPFLRGILGDSRQIQSQAFYYLAQLLEKMAQVQPVVFFLENAQWLDSGSLDLIAYLLTACRQLPLLFLFMVRPAFFERFPEWSADGRPPEEGNLFYRLDLQPLTAAQSRQLLGKILEAAPSVPAQLEQLIVDRAAGNPFYLEELVKMLIDDGVIISEKPQWEVRLERLVPDRVPPTLIGVLQARLDALTAAEREVLQRAAVVGQSFWSHAVYSLRPKAGNEAQQILRSLVEKEMIFCQESSTFEGTTEYSFRHSLFHTITYQSVLLQQRAVYHAAVADWLQTQAAERVGEVAGVIAGHYERAGRDKEAARWYQRAGQRACEAYLPEAAIAYYEQALAYLPDDDSSLGQKIALFEGLGEMLARQARQAETLAAYQAMRSTAQEAGNLAAEVQALTLLAQVERRLGRTREALAYAEQAERLASQAGDEAAAGLARATAIQGWCYYTLGNVERAIDLGERALVLSRKIKARQEEALILTLMGIIHEAQGKYAEAAAYKQQVLAVYQELGNRWGVGIAYNNLGENARCQGDFLTALTYYEQALSIALETGNRESQLSCYNNIGATWVGLGDYQAAWNDLQRVLQMAEDRSWYALSETYCFLAEACLGLGQEDQAREAALRALELGLSREQQDFVGAAWRMLGAVASRTGPLSIDGRQHTAARCFAKSEELFRESGMEAERARTLRAWGEYEVEQGERQKGEQMLAEAQVTFESLGLDREKKHPS